MKPTVVWLTGLSGAGKSTIANALNDILKADGHRSGIADADKISYRSKIGFDIESRWKAVNCMIYTVRNMFEYQKAEIVIVASISPLIAMREHARDILTKYSNAIFIEVFVDTPLDECERRDVKGLYKKYRDGIIRDMSGIDSPYENSIDPDVWLPYKSPYYNELTVDKAVEIIYNRFKQL